MTLRKEFEASIKTENISKLFESSNKEYIKWLESKLKKLKNKSINENKE